jgi:hypothetical protein
MPGCISTQPQSTKSAAFLLLQVPLALTQTNPTKAQKAAGFLHHAQCTVGAALCAMRRNSTTSLEGTLTGMIKGSSTEARYPAAAGCMQPA